MKLIGMLDSPYVRRAAIGLQLLGLEFEHQSLSVFGGFDAFKHIHPVVKAPTLLLDDGTALIDSTLILQYAEAISAPDKTLQPRDVVSLQTALRRTGLALAACEKTVQIVYEKRLRPAEKQHAPWLERVGGQLWAAYAALEKELAVSTFAGARGVGLADPLTDADVTIAVAWRFTQMMVAEIVDEKAFPALRAFSAFAETLPVFLNTPPD